ncbi:MAG: DUF4349 domain-containing protein [Clostridia bacterium]|nr:DUF4349 domain-containing protein [Clostridia bacterium]
MKLNMRVVSCFIVFALILGILLSFSSCGESESGGMASEGAGSVDKSEGFVSNDSEKIIVEMSVYAVTDSFDADHARLKSEIAAIGGYVANSSISYQENNGNYLNMTIKVPAEKASAFAESLADYLEIRSSEVSSEDVTAEYIDLESRIAALESERDSLQGIMENTDDYNNMMVVSKRLYEVIAELESQKALLASLDQRIAYSTIYLTLSESEEEVTGQNDGFFTRLGREFMNSLDFVGNFFTALAILLVGNLPILLVIGAVVVLIVWIRRKRKKARAKSQNEQQ